MRDVACFFDLIPNDIGSCERMFGIYVLFLCEIC